VSKAEDNNLLHSEEKERTFAYGGVRLWCYLTSDTIFEILEELVGIGELKE